MEKQKTPNGGKVSRGLDKRLWFLEAYLLR